MAEKTKSTDFLARKAVPGQAGPNAPRAVPAFSRVGEVKSEPVKQSGAQPLPFKTSQVQTTSKPLPAPVAPLGAGTLVSPDTITRHSLTERLRQTASIGQPLKKVTKKVATKKTTTKTAAKKAPVLKKAVVKVELKTTSPSTADRQVRSALKKNTASDTSVIHKSAKDGKIVSAAKAAKNPDTTYATKVPSGKTNATVKVTKVGKTPVKTATTKVAAKKAPAKKTAKK